MASMRGTVSLARSAPSSARRLAASSAAWKACSASISATTPNIRSSRTIGPIGIIVGKSTIAIIVVTTERQDFLLRIKPALVAANSSEGDHGGMGDLSVLKRWRRGGARAMILKSETYNFHRLDLTRQAGFIVTVYDEDGLKLAATMPFSTPCRGIRGSAKNRRQQGRGTEKITRPICRCGAGASSVSALALRTVGHLGAGKTSGAPFSPSAPATRLFRRSHLR